MSRLTEFIGFPKIPRFYRECIITEKIDGTNGCIVVENGEIRAASRNRWITPENDNHGFAQWAEDHKEELLELGDGRHFGEWYGKGINHGYGRQDRAFALFNVDKWTASRPACCEVVPVLYKGDYTDNIVGTIISDMRKFGVSGVGTGEPEGLMVYFVLAGQYFKVLCKNDETRKGLVDKSR